MTSSKHKCLKCGHVFIHIDGDFIHNPQKPVCPKCHSILTIKIS